MTERRKVALQNLGIDESHRVMLCLDGGGIRGIMTLQLLRRLEQIAGAPCHEFVDLVAGTSTGGIIAGLIAKGHTAAGIDDLYRRLVKKVFKSNGWTKGRFLNPPAYTKVGYRSILKEIVGDELTLREAAMATDTDIVITAKDVAAGEETFFTCFRDPASGSTEGTYQGVLLRAVLEATMSAPTYFHPFERFVDGGITTYNNPSLAALVEAIRYGPRGAYEIGKLTMLSFGTGCRPQFVKVDDVINPRGNDALFWLQWLMTEAGDDASDMQNAMMRTRGLFGGFDFRRFQISLDEAAIHQLEDRPLGDVDETDARSLHELTNRELADIQLDNVAYFPVMQVIGEAFADYVVAQAQQHQHAPFGRDLVDARGRELLVTRSGDVQRIKAQLSDKAWVDGFKPV